MKKISKALAFIVLAVAVMSCGLISRFTNVWLDMTKTDVLWSDVPPMDGLDHSVMELPLPIKLMMRAMLNNLWRFNKEGEDKTPVSGDWIVFTSAKSPTDVQSFYTSPRMASFGNWETNKDSTCLDGKDKGIDGVLCVFKKVADGKEVILAVIATPDSEAKRTNVFFLRLEKPVDNANGPSR
jgi:hypothetical protein